MGSNGRLLSGLKKAKNIGLFDQSDQSPAQGDAAPQKAPTPKSIRNNLIVFLGSSTGAGNLMRASSRGPATDFARGLVHMGYRVLMVSYDLSVHAKRAQPSKIETGIDLVVSIDTKNLVAYCDKYDFVVVMDDRVSVHAYLDWNKYAGRMIALQGVFLAPNTMAPRMFGIYASERPSVLWIDTMSANRVKAIVRGKNVARYIMLSNRLPVIATHYPGTDTHEFTKAILGYGDSRRYYVDHYAGNRYRVASSRQATKATSTMGGLATTVGGCALWASGDPFLLACTGGVSALAILATSLWERATMRNPFTDKALAERNVQYLFPNVSGHRITRSVSAPALIEGLQIESSAPSMEEIMQAPVPTDPQQRSAYESDLAWAKVNKRYRIVLDRWLDYELNITKMLDAPLIIDYSVPQTAALHAAAVEAADLKESAEDAAHDVTALAVARTLFAESVTRLEVAFNVAEAYALKSGIRGFSEQEQKKIERSKKLFTLALNASTSDAERSSALTQARKEIEGVIVVSDQIVQKALESANLRVQITE